MSANLSTEKFRRSSSASDQAPHLSAYPSPPIKQTPPPSFSISQLWSEPVINPVNLKCQTLPLLNFRSPYARNFHLAWLGFFVAFLSWFAFPPLFPEAIKKDLALTNPQVANSNIVALTATLIVRLFVGALVDRVGPRYVMAGILVAGAIPSFCVYWIKTPGHLYAVRFFIGILGGTFVPCVAWTSSFFDKNVVGRANGLSAGWGNAGGGATYAVMVSLYNSFHKHTSQHRAWRLSFIAVPVPVLFLTAALVLLFGTDSPAGHWSQRHLVPATEEAVKAGHEVVLDHSEQQAMQMKKRETAEQTVQEVDIDAENQEKRERQVGAMDSTVVRGDIDVAVADAPSFGVFWKVVKNPMTWLPALAYMTTFGFELFVDSTLATILLNPHPKLGQLNAGYYASIYGLLNIFTRPLGGYFADKLYEKYKTPAVKKYFTLTLGVFQGIFTIAFGALLWTQKVPSFAGMMILMVIIAFFNEFANGANFSLVPHCNAYSNGIMSGLVGAFGNIGGIIFALIGRYETKRGRSYLYAGVIATGVNLVLFLFPTPKH